MCGNRFPATDGIDPFVGLALDADARGVDAQDRRERRAHRIDVRLDLRRLEDDGHVDVADFVAMLADQRDGAGQEIKTGRVLPARIVIRKVAADVALAGGAEDGVGDSVTDDVRVRMA